MIARLAAVLCALSLLAAPAALAQSDAFGPLPPPAPEQTPQPTPPPGSGADDGDVSRELLFGVGGALLAVFVVIGMVITRDARRTVPQDGRSSARLREEGPHRHERAAKRKARQKGRAQRKARRTTRRRAR